MQPSEIWNDSTVFIETCLQHGRIGAALLRAGMKRYLGLSSDSARVASAASEHPELEHNLACASWRHKVAQNNAQVLILSGPSVLYLWRYRSVRHANYVAWLPKLSLTNIFATLGWLIYLCLGRYSRPMTVELPTDGGQTERLIVCRVLKVRGRKGARHFIPHTFDMTQIFDQFDKHNIVYAVLRWFETLPKIDPGEDVDLLVDDESLPALLDLLNSWPGIQPTDVYTPSGLPKSDYRNTPYYPPHAAKELLKRRVKHRDVCYVPSPADYLASLAYHAVYHKGPAAGVPCASGAVAVKENPDHDYTKILGDMARNLGVSATITLEGLREYLDKVGWGPSPDMLMRLAANATKNKWLAHLTANLEHDARDPGLVVFVIRREGVRRGFQQQIINMIMRAGFEILATKTLSPQEVEYSAQRTRGGNWGKGFYKQSGGPPAMCVVAYDAHPIKPTRKQLKKYPQVVNARQFIKDEIRDAIIAQLPPEEECNVVHSSDYGGEAWYFLEVYAPEMVEALGRQLGERRAKAEVRRAA